MSRSNKSVKQKLPSKVRSPGLVDLHFHGAFGVDLIHATPEELTELAIQLGHAGIAGFCPTTLSLPLDELGSVVEKLGRWSQGFRESAESVDYPVAFPLGLHLEGPFINPKACGAHPPKYLKPATVPTLEKLWKQSRGEIARITLAPEIHTSANLKKISDWAAERGILLSVGHSLATEAQTRAAFDLGITSVTHAWNALGFHHREPGVLGAALGRPDIAVELIIDGHHVSPTVLEWTRKLHPENLCFVSDCLSAAGSPGKRGTLGPLQIRWQKDVCCTPNGALAGGGKILTHAFVEWLQGRPPTALLPALHHVIDSPLKLLGVTPEQLPRFVLEWNEDFSFEILIKS